MCGIAGIIDTGPAARTTVESMCSRLLHRGPDSLHVVPLAGAVLGHTRLSVIDLETGQQPISNEDQTVWVVLNGEIYNYKALRQELQAKGHRFTTQSDTETIVHLYEEEGPACVKRLHGMFAFALWDERNQRLMLARDRVGKKPLYYSANKGRLVFASELQALLRATDVRTHLDPVAVDEYLAYGYVSAPRSIVASVSKLPPAHVLLAESGRTETTRYWSLDAQPHPPTSERELAEELRDRLQNAVAARLVADVPLGFLLSGGIDSSAIVAMAASATAEPLHTFSIGFDDASFNELPHARSVAERFGTRHEELTIGTEIRDVAQQAIDSSDEPFADASIVPMYTVSKLARTRVTVALGGDGGDECFAGYDRYAALKLAHSYYRLPYRLRSQVVAPIAALIPESTRKLDRARRLKHFLTPAYRTPEEQYARWLRIFSTNQRAGIYTAAFAETLATAGGHTDVVLEALARSTAAELLSKAQAADFATYLPGDLMHKADSMSMAHGLEIRSPFLDHEMVEFAASIPVGLKLKGLSGKHILKQAMAGQIPDQVLQRRKEGFSVPIAGWLRASLGSWMQDLVGGTDARIAAIVSPTHLDRLVRSHLSGQANNGLHLWTLICLEAWCRRENIEPAFD